MKNIEYHLMVNRAGRVELDSVHATIDSAIATKYKRLYHRAYFVKTVERTADVVRVNAEGERDCGY